MSEREREVDIPGMSDADDSYRDQLLNARDGRASSPSNDDERRAAAPDSRTGEPRVSADDIDASRRAWGDQEYGEVM